MSAASTKEKVLIIDSNHRSADQVADELKKAGYLVYTIADGAKAIETISDTEPNLIILDLSIAGIDAYELLTQKSADKRLAKIPVIALSSQGETINMRKVPEGSVVDFVISLKPDPTDILDRVNRRFGHTSITTMSTEKKTVLWVEDDKLIGSILGRKFTGSNFNLLHANNGQEALDLVKENKPDIFIFDLMLPGMDGFEILQKVRMDDRFKKTPAIILSNLSKPSDFEKAKMLGVTKYLVKASSSLDQIILEVATILGVIK